MTPPLRSLLPWLTSLGLLLAPLPGMGESRFSSQANSVSGSLDFRIVIPPIIRVLENSHPDSLNANADGAWNGQQRLVVLSNMKRGFCVTLRQTDPQWQAWTLSTSQDNGVSLSPVADGYRLCTARPGRYTLLLEHEFRAPTDGSAIAARWPVQTDLMAM